MQQLATQPIHPDTLSGPLTGYYLRRARRRPQKRSEAIEQTAWPCLVHLLYAPGKPEGPDTITNRRQ